MLERLNDYDWEAVFNYANPDPADHNDTVSKKPFSREDVEEVYGISDGYNDGDDWIAYGKLTDGRYFFISAWCDYTGWGCQEGGRSYVGSTLDKVRLIITSEDWSRMHGSQEKAQGTDQA
jgi:hypothetical protein